MQALAGNSLRNNGYLARQEIERLQAALRNDPKRLEPFGYKAYSQGDEDGIIAEIFRRLAIAEGSFLEIGVENGLECNSLLLIHKGWTGAWVEGNRQQQEVIAAKFGSLIQDKTLNVGMGMVDAGNINALASQVGAVEDLDFLSIDIDGNDIYVFEAVGFKPKVVCIEYNAKFPPDVAARQVYDPKRYWRGTDYFGPSLRAMNEIAIAKGYRLVSTGLTGVNAFFVRADLAGALFDDDASPENLYNPPRYWLIFDHYRHVGHQADFGPYVWPEKSKGVVTV